jgi:hypothetical protein
MTSDKADDASRDALNRGLDKEQQRLRDADKRSSQRAEESTGTEPDRPAASQEDAEQSDIAHLENPPQTEGPRERSNEGV